MLKEILVPIGIILFSLILEFLVQFWTERSLHKNNKGKKTSAGLDRAKIWFVIGLGNVLVISVLHAYTYLNINIGEGKEKGINGWMLISVALQGVVIILSWMWIEGHIARKKVEKLAKDRIKKDKEKLGFAIEISKYDYDENCDSWSKEYAKIKADRSSMESMGLYPDALVIKKLRKWREKQRIKQNRGKK